MGINSVTNRVDEQTESIHNRELEVFQIDVDTSECDHSKVQHEIDDKDIVEDFLGRMVWGHLDFDKTKSPTEVWGTDHRENETGYD